MSEQAGAARALAPVVQDLERRHHTVVIHADEPACNAFEEDELVTTPLAAASELMALAQPAAVLTGTSTGDTVERDLIVHARRAGVPTVGVLDSWVNLTERFTGRTAFEYLPDRLAVMDEATRSLLVSAGAPASNIVSTGHPHLDRVKVLTASQRSSVRARLGATDDHLLVVFASEPLSDEQTNPLPFDELSVLRDILAITATGRARVRLIVRPHPREGVLKLNGVLRGATADTSVDRSVPSRELVAAADVVIGMTTILLIEAAIAGTRAVSYQPGCAESDTYFGNRLGVTRGVFSAQTLASEFESRTEEVRQQESTRTRGLLKLDGGAAQRVADLIIELTREAHLEIV